MNLPKYDIISNKSLQIFSFISEGEKGNIEKIVIFEETDKDGIFNLVLVDKDPITGVLDDEIVTNNGDTEKVLARVISIIYLFTEKNPAAYVYVEGSSYSRNRLYRRSVTKFLKEALEDFTIWGILPNKNIEYFSPNIDYIGFLVQRKIK